MDNENFQALHRTLNEEGTTSQLTQLELSNKVNKKVMLSQEKCVTHNHFEAIAH